MTNSLLLTPPRELGGLADVWRCWFVGLEAPRGSETARLPRTIAHNDSALDGLPEVDHVLGGRLRSSLCLTGSTAQVAPNLAFRTVNGHRRYTSDVAVVALTAGDVLDHTSARTIRRCRALPSWRAVSRDACDPLLLPRRCPVPDTERFVDFYGRSGPRTRP